MIERNEEGAGYLASIELQKGKSNNSIAAKGGAGSGNFGHAGRAGKIGGSASASSSSRKNSPKPSDKGDTLIKRSEESAGYLASIALRKDKPKLG